MLVAAHDMPLLSSEYRHDPALAPSRMTVGMLVESILSKGRVCTAQVNATPFNGTHRDIADKLGLWKESSWR
jgi:DNA-directed RNA polymerase beta subunit